MTLPEALELFDFWKIYPPEGEMLHFFARVYTTWSPGPPMTEAQAQAEHRKSLEQRWRAGSMSAADMVGIHSGGPMALTTTGSLVHGQQS